MDEIRIFISYSHDNEIWLTEWLDALRQAPNPRYLLKQWQRKFRKEPVQFWYDREKDTGLRGGEAWRDRIFGEIDKADVAILLVTQDFVLSPFIMDEELPRILSRYRSGGLEVVPVLVQPATVKDLAIDGVLQWAPGNPTPLSDYLDRSPNEFEKAKIQLLDALESAVNRVKAKRAGSVRDKTATEAMVAESSSVTAPQVERHQASRDAQPDILPSPSPDKPAGAVSGSLTQEDRGSTVRAGMGKDEVIAAWGEPARIDDESAHGVDNCLWDYGGASGVGSDYRVQFVSGKVSKILVNRGPSGHSMWVESWSRKPAGSPSTPASPTLRSRAEPDGQPVGGVIVVDSSGTRTRLLKYGIVYRPFAANTLANAFLEGIVIERGKASQTVPWDLLKEVTVSGPDAADIRLRDGRTMQGVKLRRGSVVGTDEFDMPLSLSIKDLHTLEVQ